MTTVITGAWGKRRQFYVDTFLPAFHQHWPGAVDLRLYLDGVAGLPVLLGGRSITTVQLRAGGDVGVAGYDAFIRRHGERPEANGLVPARCWKGSEREKGYSFRTDAVKFAGQGFAPWHASTQLLDGELLAWFDADVVTHTSVPAGWLESLVGDADGAYLGRGRKHSEIGFWAVRLNEGTRAFLMALLDLYVTDRVFELPQTHSAFAWDDCRQWAEKNGLMRLRDLTPGQSGHVWPTSPLNAYTDHLKGPRKELGRSPERSRR